jgi:hypothetical protein
VIENIRRILAFTAAASAICVFQTAHADWQNDVGAIVKQDPQDVVISLKSDPNHDPEAACLAVTFARNLSRNKLNANITLFVTLDGVNLASDNYISKRRLKEYECTTPFEDDPPHVTLKDNLIKFLSETDPDGAYDENPNLVVCPICWNERYGEELPDYGVLPGANGVSPTAIGAMIFSAEKILDF